MATKKQTNTSEFPERQYGFIDQDGDLLWRDEIPDITEEMEKGESCQVAWYKLEKVVVVTKVNDYTIKPA